MALASSHLTGVVLSDTPSQYGTEGVTELMIAAFHGDTGKVHQLLTEDHTQLTRRNHHSASALDYAISKKQVKVVDALLAHGADLDAVGPDGYNALHRSALSGQLQMVQTCVEMGLNVDCHCSTGDTALLLAVKQGSISVVRYLIRMSCNLTIKDKEEFSAKDHAFLNDRNDIKCLLDQETDLSQLIPADIVNDIFVASKKGDLMIMELLIHNYSEAVANVADLTTASVTPMIVACQANQLAAAQLLKQNGASVYSKTVSGLTALHMAAKSGHTHIVDWLVIQGALCNATTVNQLTPLHFAVNQGNLQMVQKLVEGGALLNVMDKHCQSPLYTASMQGFGDIVNYLLQQGAWPELVCKDSVTALGAAAAVGHIQCMKYLLEHNADIDKPQTRGYSPLMLATMRNHYEAVKFLVQNGANVSFISYTGITATELAHISNNAEIYTYFSTEAVHSDRSLATTVLTEYVQAEEETHFTCSQSLEEKLLNMCKEGLRKQEQLKQFIDSGTNLNIQTDGGKTPLIIAVIHNHECCVNWLLQHDAQVDLTDSSGMTPLMHAAEVGHMNVVKVLLANGADISKTDETGRNVLAIAEISKKMSVVKMLEAHENMKLCEQSRNFFSAVEQADYSRCVQLIQSGVDVNAIDAHGNTALSICIMTKSPLGTKMAKLLCESDFDTELTDSCGRTPLQLCVHWGNADIAEILLEYGVKLESSLPHILLETCVPAHIELTRTILKYLKNINPNKRQEWLQLALYYSLTNNERSILSILEGEISNLKYPLAAEHLSPKLFHAMHVSTVEIVNKVHGVSVNNQDTCFNKRKLHGQLLRALLDDGDYEQALILTGRNAVLMDTADEKIEIEGEINKHSHFLLHANSRLHANPIPISKQNVRLVWLEIQDLLYTAVKDYVDRYPCHSIIGLSRSQDNYKLFIHARKGNREEVKCYISQLIGGLPHCKMVDIQVVKQNYRANMLPGLMNYENIEPINQCFLKEVESGCSKCHGCGCNCDGWEHTSTSFMGCFIQDQSNIPCILTTASNLQIPYGHPAGMLKLKEKLCVLMNCSKCRHMLLKDNICYYGFILQKATSVNIAVITLMPNQIDHECGFSEMFIYSGSSECMLKRIVVKTGCDGYITEGIITDVDVSFRDQQGNFHHGTFIVSSVDQTRPFAVPGDCGAVIADKESGVVFGLVLAEQRSYASPAHTEHNENVCFGILLCNGLKFVFDRWKLQLGKFKCLS